MTSSGLYILRIPSGLLAGEGCALLTVVPD